MQPVGRHPREIVMRSSNRVGDDGRQRQVSAGTIAQNQRHEHSSMCHPELGVERSGTLSKCIQPVGRRPREIVVRESNKSG